MAVFTFQPDDTTGIDCWLASLSPNTNSNDGYIQVGENAGDANVYHGLYKVDFLSQVPSSFVPTACTFTFKALAAGVSRTLQMFRVKRNWVETEATHNSYSTGNAWGTAGCENTTSDRDATPIGSQAFASSGSPITVTITLDAAGLVLLREMIRGTTPNYGFMLRFDTQLNDSIGFYSSAAVTASNRPLCTLTGSAGGSDIIII